MSNVIHEVKKNAKDQVAASNETVVNRLVQTLVEKEVADRTRILNEALTLQDRYEGELKKAEQPDLTSYDATGTATGPGSFSKPKIEALKKLRENINKLDNALNKAFAETNADWNLLRQLVAQTKGGDQNKGAGGVALQTEKED